MTKDKLIELENKAADIEMRKMIHLSKVMDIGFLLGSGKTYEDYLEIIAEKEGK
ncbi:MAG: hypothetical protein DDT18_00888 [Actinobacteria bacterium]|nr:hypothetical protein [Actinomycetota bacterium]